MKSWNESKKIEKARTKQNERGTKNGEMERKKKTKTDQQRKREKMKKKKKEKHSKTVSKLLIRIL